MKKTPFLYVLIVEPGNCVTLGPFFKEQEADIEAKRAFKEIASQDSLRAQRVQSMLLAEVINDRLDITAYPPEFIIQALKECDG